MREKAFLPDFNDLFLPSAKDFFRRKKEAARGMPSIIDEAIDRIEDLTLSGGKRIRPALLYYSYQIFGAGSFEKVKNYCLALEILHSFALIHDDIMDKGEKRRGRETASFYFQKKFKSKDLSNNLAILCGDLAFAWADELFYADNNKKLFDIFSLLKEEVIYGQLLDVVKVKTEAEILQMMQFKTAGYTIEKPLILGALLGEASEAQLEVLKSMGIALGLAFQIQDDILGVFGETKTLGKPVDSDLKEGKMNLLAIKTLKKLKGTERSSFLTIWGNPKSGAGQLQKVRQLMAKSGGLEDCLHDYHKLKKKALENLKNLTLSQKGNILLSGLIDEILVLDKDNMIGRINSTKIT